MVPLKGAFSTRQEELEFTRSVLRKMMSAVREPVMILKPDYTIVDVNDALLQSVGRTRQEVIGGHCHRISHGSPEPCNPPLHECPLREALATGVSTRALHEHHSAESELRYFDVAAFPILDRNGEAEYILEIWYDISEVLATEIEKKAAQIKQGLTKLVHEDKMIALGKLVASAVHEINNPISAILTFSKIMLRMLDSRNGGLTDEDMDEMERYLEIIANESKRCGDIVSNLLSFSRHKKLTRGEVDINDIVDKILLLLNHKLELQNIAVSVDLQPGLPRVSADLNQLQQVIMNLMFNAMESMPDGGRLGVRTHFDTGPETVVVEITDTGCGIAAEDRSRIFEPFFTTKSGGIGVGLGLAVIYGIVKEHEGTIDFDSEPGKGTTFRASFPGVRPDCDA